MPSDDEWKELIDATASQRSPSIKAIGFRKCPRGSFAAPPLLECDNGGEYWVKHMMVNRMTSGAVRSDIAGGMITDHLIGILAMKLQAEAVPEVRLVSIEPELISFEQRLANARPGLAHGSKNAAINCSDRLTFSHAGFNALPINRSRVAALAVLYGLTQAADHQVIYRLASDPLVFSVDHGHFFPSGPNWTIASLAGAASGAVDPIVTSECGLTPNELSAPLQRLSELTATQVAEVVSAPPDEWSFSEQERVAIARFLWKKRDEILKSYH